MDNYEYNKLYTEAQVSKKDTTFRIGDEESDQTPKIPSEPERRV